MQFALRSFYSYCEVRMPQMSSHVCLASVSWTDWKRWNRTLARNFIFSFPEMRMIQVSTLHNGILSYFVWFVWVKKDNLWRHEMVIKQMSVYEVITTHLSPCLPCFCYSNLRHTKNCVIKTRNGERGTEDGGRKYSGNPHNSLKWRKSTHKKGLNTSFEQACFEIPSSEQSLSDGR